MALDVTAVVVPGPATITFGATDLGHTDENGVEGTFKTELIEAKVGKYGELPVSVWRNGTTAEVKFRLMQTDFTILEKAFPDATKVTSGANSKLTFGTIAGKKITAAALTVKSQLGASFTPKYDLTLGQAVPVGEFVPVYSGGKFQGWDCTFRGLADEGGGTDGKYTGQYGDSTISGDAAVPTLSTVVPADAATGVVVSTTVVATMSEELDARTVDTASVLLMQDDGPGTNLTQVVGTVALVNNGSSTTITFTPSANLAAAKVHRFVLLPTIKDKNGNALAFFDSDFTTA